MCFRKTPFDFNESEIEYALFSGIEQEGPRKGMKTLFVVGYVSDETIEQNLNNERYDQIYFGAGGWFDYSKNQIQRFSKYLITIENPVINVDILTQSGVMWMCPVLWKGNPIESNYLLFIKSTERRKICIKIDTNNKVICSLLSDMYINTYDTYTEDKIILEKRKV